MCTVGHPRCGGGRETSKEGSMRRIVVSAVAAILLVAVVALAAQQKFTLPGIPNPDVATYAPEIGKYGGTYVTSTISDPRTFNAIVSQDTVSSAVTDVMFDSLVGENYITGEIVPALAESWTVSPDGRTWVFTLRQGVQWSDGKPLTMADVLFSLKAIFTEGVDNSIRSVLTFDDKPVQYRALDNRRIQFRTERPIGLFLRFIGFNVMPAHKLADVLAKGGAEFSKTWGINVNPREMVGSGAFLLAQYVPGQRIVMLRNTNYYVVDTKGQRLPYLTRYVILIVPGLEQSRLKFLARETDAYAARAREFAELKAQERAGNFTIYDGPETFSSEFVVFNQNPAGISGPKLAWFQDVRFRRALNHAIDRATISQQIHAGRSTAAWGPVSVGNKLYHNPNLPQYAYNLDRAQQLLAEAGYRKGSDGTLRDAQGNIVEFVISTNAGNPDREAIGNILRQDWTKLGIRVTFAPESFPSLVGKLTGTYKWDAIVIGLTGGIEPGTGRNVWLTTGDLHMWRPNQSSPATDWEREVDNLFEQIAREANQEKRKALYFRWQQIIAEQVPIAYFAYPKTQPAVRNTIGNVKIGLQGVTGTLETRYYKGVLRP
jgi:peptide/nickel transport system substrate-binding protein